MNPIPNAKVLVCFFFSESNYYFYVPFVSVCRFFLYLIFQPQYNTIQQSLNFTAFVLLITRGFSSITAKFHHLTMNTVKMNRNVFPFLAMYLQFLTFYFGNLYCKNVYRYNNRISQFTDRFVPVFFFFVHSSIVINRHVKCTMNNYTTVCLLRECTSFDVSFICRTCHNQK